MKSDRAMKLMAYADGELEGAELTEVEGWLATDAESVLFANDLAELGDVLALGYPATSAFDVADAVMAGVAKEPAAKPAANASVSSLDAARGRRAARLRGATYVVAALALAASVFVVTRNKGEVPLARTETPVVQPSSPGASPGTAVDVENPGQSVSVFYLPNENSVTNVTTSVVVWVDESGGK